MSDQHDVECMAHALRLARQGRFTTRPNPNVGCVIVDAGGDLVAAEFHRRAGDAHAEILALQKAGEKARGATVYVSLEPCCHQGKTGPCTQALIAAEVKRVVVAMQDPNPQVAGKGIEQLQQHGIQVDCGVLTEQAQELNAGFVKRMQSGIPYVTVKSAISIAGKTALHNGTSKWITDTAARNDVQRLRAQSDAVMTGIGTVLADDPSLNVRLTPEQLGLNEEVMQPARVVIDPQLQMPAQSKMFSLPGQTIVFAGRQSASQMQTNVTGGEVVLLEEQQGQLDLRQVLQQLAQREINSVLVEAGSNLVGNLMAQNLVDEMIIYVAPKIFGSAAKGMAEIGAIDIMDEHISLEYKDVRRVGDDLKITALIKH